MVGILALATELSTGIKNLLNFYNPTGPLSGKTTVAIIVWLVAWFVLARLWGDKTVDMDRVIVVSFVLLALSFLLTFPPVWYLFTE